VLITGGSRGLGLLLSREFARRGARLVITARDPGELERAERELRCTGADVLAYPCDISNSVEIPALVATATDWFGSIDVLVNNAGIIQVGPLDTVVVEDFERAMATHFWGPLRLTLAVLPEMRRRREGRVVNVSSVAGLVGVPHLLPYVTSKFALTGFSDAIRTELARDDVRVTTVCPGFIRTGGARHALIKGHHRAEYAWFSIADSLPLVSMGGARAARRIVRACERGEARIVLTPHAKLAVICQTLFPSLFAFSTALANRALPASPDDGAPESKRAQRGAESESALSPSALTVLADRAAVHNNEAAPTTLRW
jgi:NAD(P)-dependent dehydrogenase (short-subunit alcohol dehydrogenase family)